jgi:DNA-binding NarL/FixJ family response regulator
MGINPAPGENAGISAKVRAMMMNLPNFRTHTDPHAYRVLVADDEPGPFRMVWAFLVDNPAFELVDEVNDPEQLEGKVEQHKPDVVIIDWDFGRFGAENNGVALASKLRSKHPTLGILMLTGLGGPAVMHEFFEAVGKPYSGFIKKGSDLDQGIADHIRRVVKGNWVISDSLQADYESFQAYRELSPDNRALLHLFAVGYEYTDIAKMLKDAKLTPTELATNALQERVHRLVDRLGIQEVAANNKQLNRRSAVANALSCFETTRHGDDVIDKLLAATRPSQ